MFRFRGGTGYRSYGWTPKHDTETSSRSRIHVPLPMTGHRPDGSHRPDHDIPAVSRPTAPEEAAAPDPLIPCGRP